MCQERYIAVDNVKVECPENCIHSFSEGVGLPCLTPFKIVEFEGHAIRPNFNKHICCIFCKQTPSVKEFDTPDKRNRFNKEVGITYHIIPDLVQFDYNAWLLWRGN